jgi:hypothetical protein
MRPGPAPGLLHAGKVCSEADILQYFPELTSGTGTLSFIIMMAGQVRIGKSTE